MAGTSTLMALKASSEARSSEDRIAADRNRAILVLSITYLQDNGYVESAAVLEREGGIPLTRFQAADNVDLSSIIKEYEEYYELKLGKKPKLVRKVDGDGQKEPKGRVRPPKVSGATNSKGVEKAKKADGLTAAQTEKYMTAAANAGVSSQQLRGIESKLDVPHSSNPPCAPGDSLDINSGSDGNDMQGISGNAMRVVNRKEDKPKTMPVESIEDRLLKPLPFAGDPDLRALAHTITRDIFQSNPGVTWDDVVSLNEAKRLLKEAVVMPVKYPFLFTGLLSPWQGILLYGPPGTGKTMLAKAVATECHTTFFNISASSIVSKYRGDSEKLVRVLFELARYHAPSTIFLDEIDAIMGQRGGFDGASEHEGSRRMKTELLIQMDGLAKTSALVFVLAASNIPWELDMALLRRLEKRVLVSLPDQTARLSMLEKLLLGRTSTGESGGGERVAKALHPLSSEVDLKDVAARTEGYSGSDIRLLCKEVAMKPVRRMMFILEEMELDPMRGGRVASEAEVAAVRANDPITLQDMDQAVQATNPSSNTKYTERYREWERGFGST